VEFGGAAGASHKAVERQLSEADNAFLQDDQGNFLKSDKSKRRGHSGSLLTVLKQLSSNVRFIRRQ
jgi:hypothetical protein